jgi:hypothetical protein
MADQNALDFSEEIFNQSLGVPKAVRPGRVVFRPVPMVRDGRALFVTRSRHRYPVGVIEADQSASCGIMQRQ